MNFNDEIKERLDRIYEEPGFRKLSKKMSDHFTWLIMAARAYAAQEYLIGNKLYCGRCHKIMWRVKHGTECLKLHHSHEKEFNHDPDDDGEIIVDDRIICGRCHDEIGKKGTTNACRKCKEWSK